MSAVPSTVTDFYRWGFWASPIRIHLSLEVIGRIRKELEASADREGAISGYGLLIGDTHEPGITRILNFHPLQRLSAVAVQAAARGLSGELIGFYRTTSPGANSMSDADRAIASTFFARPNCVFLLIETVKSGAGDARFCFWSEGELFDWPVMIFPFNPATLATKEWQLRSKNAGAATEIAPTREVAETGPQAVSVPKPPEPWPAGAELKPIEPGPVARWLEETGRRRLPQAGAVVLLVLLFAAVSLYFGGSPSPPPARQIAATSPPVEIQLGLAAEKRAGGLMVSWNGNAAILSKAEFGMLVIRSRDLTRELPLTAVELRAGGVVYAPTSERAQLELSVVAGGQLSRESLTVQAAIPESPPGVTEAPPTPLPVAPALVVPGSTPTPPAIRREFKPAAERASAEPVVPRIGEPPQAASQAPVNGGALFLLSQVPVPVQPPAAPVTKQAASPAGLPPASQPTPAQVPAKAPVPQASAPPGTAEARPPVATYRVAPSVPSQLKTVLWAHTVVEVKVSVDASGSVVRAEAVPKSGVHPLLRDAAVQAARRWKFQPAQFNGHAVPADTVLQFTFAASR
jgi:periplasmic protein TonB